ncbi:hypothetical protein WJX79_004103 [Trebouxia sp. C0005]
MSPSEQVQLKAAAPFDFSSSDSQNTPGATIKRGLLQRLDDTTTAHCCFQKALTLNAVDCSAERHVHDEQASMVRVVTGNGYCLHRKPPAAFR